MRSTRTTLAGALLGVLALLATGCGVAGTQFHPGVAAQIGDVTISDRHVDALASNYCLANKSQITPGNRVPLRYLRSGIAGQLALVAAVQQLADEEGVTAGQAYRSRKAMIQTQVAGLDKAQADAVVEVESGSSYLSDILTQVGTKALAAQGTSNPTTDQVQQAGQQALSKWIDTHTADINPSYGVTIKGGTVALASDDLSYPEGGVAKAGAAASPDAAYAAALPASQACG